MRLKGERQKCKQSAQVSDMTVFLASRQVVSAPTSPAGKQRQSADQTAAAPEASSNAAQPSSQQAASQKEEASTTQAPQNLSNNAASELKPADVSQKGSEGDKGSLANGQVKEQGRGEPAIGVLSREADAGAESDDMFQMDEASLSIPYSPPEEL